LELICHILTTKVKNRGGSKLEHFPKEKCFCSLNQPYICSEVSVTRESIQLERGTLCNWYPWESQPPLSNQPFKLKKALQQGTCLMIVMYVLEENEWISPNASNHSVDCLRKRPP
jgi:hypothetical protein